MGRRKKVVNEIETTDINIPNIPKRRGRPPKNRVEQPKQPEQPEQPEQAIIPKKRGRPPKIRPITENAQPQPQPEIPVNIPKRRGRPPKVVKVEESTPVKTYPLLGYCTECSMSLGSGDIDKTNNKFVICIRCEARVKITQLKKEIDIPKYKNKKEYLENSFVVNEDFIENYDAAPAVPISDEPDITADIDTDEDDNGYISDGPEDADFGS